MKKRILLAYSGGLESSAAIPWLAERFPGSPIVAVIVDLGRRTELVGLRDRALALGVLRCHVVDARDEFIRDYLMPAMQAGAFAGDRSLVPPALERSIIAKKLVDLARMEDAGAIAFGAGRSLDRASLERLIRSLDPSLDLIAYTHTPGDDVSAGAGSGPQEIATNLWGRSVAFDAVLDGWAEVSEDAYLLTRAPKDAPDHPAYLEVELECGLPVRVNGIEMPAPEMIESLETIAGAHGVGRTDTILSRPDGAKYRAIGEAPAALVLQVAHQELESLAIPPGLARLVHDLGRAYSDAIEGGNWFSDTRTALDAFTTAIQPRVTGSIRLRLAKGDCRVVGRRLHSAKPAATGHSISGTPLVRTV
jgi:argininosuccinate synthase